MKTINHHVLKLSDQGLIAVARFNAANAHGDERPAVKKPGFDEPDWQDCCAGLGILGE
ncbi:MAG: hypothetical protein ACYCSS_12560 [Sulfuriferula sp.]